MALSQAILVLLIMSSYPLNTSCAGNEDHVLTYEEFPNLEGENFCLWPDIFREICKKMSELKNIQNYSIQNMEPCTQKEISLFSEELGGPKTTAEDLLICNYKRWFFYKNVILGRGKNQYDIIEYERRKNVFVPVINREEVLENILIIRSTKNILTVVEHQALTGKSFCSMGDVHDFNNLCAQIAKLNNSEGYVYISGNTSCFNTNISLFSEAEDKLKIVKEDLLYCEYNYDVVTDINGEKRRVVSLLDLRLLGRGKEQLDVMEYRKQNDLVIPVDNRPGLLEHIDTKLDIDNVLSIEEYQSRKGERFCSWQIMFKMICTKLAEVSDITGYDSINKAKSCYQKKISLYSTKKGTAKVTSEDLLRCEYNHVSEDAITAFHSRLLGQGLERTDVMEYKINNEVAKPVTNHVGFLLEIGNIWRSTFVLTFEGYQSLDGREFCSWREMFMIFCIKIAEVNGIKDYDNITHGKNCVYEKITLFSVWEERLKTTSEGLLKCEYNRVYVNEINGVNAQVTKPFETRLLGRGKSGTDVMEYKNYGNSVLPSSNRTGLLKTIQVVKTSRRTLTFEQHAALEGENFCSWEENTMFWLICKKAAELSYMRDYSYISTTKSCTKNNISLLSEEDGELGTIQEDLLYCDYQKWSDDLRKYGKKKGYQQIYSKLLGRGKGPNDIMEYEEVKNMILPTINRTGFMTEILIIRDTKEILTSEQHQSLRGESFCTLGEVDEWKHLCIQIAKLNGIEGYDSITESTSCVSTDITLYSTSKGELTTVKEDLFHCEYNRITKEEIDGQSQKATVTTRLNLRLLGRGKQQRDVFEYKEDNGILIPALNHSGLLEKIGMKLHTEEAITFEEYLSKKGETFCNWGSMYKMFCIKVAELNNIKSYHSITEPISCTEETILLYSENDGIMKTSLEDLLHCEYNQMTENDINDINSEKAQVVTPFELRLLGKGKSPTDIIEYKKNNEGLAVPLKNLTSLYNEIKYIMDKSFILSIEEHKSRKGQDFCSWKDMFTIFCIKLAKSRSIEGYDTITKTTSCTTETISLFSRKEEQMKTVQEDLLLCEYNRYIEKEKNGENIRSLVPFDFRLLGRGTYETDVMEYKKNKETIEPAENHNRFLDEIRIIMMTKDVITFEQHESLEGEEFCSTRNETYDFVRLCVKIAELNGIKGYHSITGNTKCTKKETKLYSPTNNNIQRVNEELLFCNYNHMKTRISLAGGHDFTEKFDSRALGRGKGKSDVIEYKFLDSELTPITPRPRLLEDIALMLTFEEHEHLEGENFCSTRKNAQDFKKLCEGAAILNSIIYDSISEHVSCTETNINLHSEAEGSMKEVKDELLFCEFILMTYDSASRTMVKDPNSNLRALGRGKKEKDVMEYVIVQDAAIPLANREDFLRDNYFKRIIKFSR